MKTLKALKITSILNGIFCFFCVASTVCFAITRYYDSNLFFSIGNILIYGWMINPIGIISFVICLPLFLTERKDHEKDNFSVVFFMCLCIIFCFTVLATVYSFFCIRKRKFGLTIKL